MADGATVHGPEAGVLDQFRHEQDAAVLALVWFKPLAARTLVQAQLNLQQIPAKGAATGGSGV